MELTDLEIFQAVARLGGVTQAAARLNRVQSGLSARLSRLENELETKLFARQGRGMTLTASGRALLDYADKILLLVGEAKACVRGDVPAGPFRLGAMESTSASRLPVLLGKYHALHPRVALELTTGATADLVRDVAACRLDAAFVSEPVTAPGFEKTEAFREELVLVDAAGRPPMGGPEGLSGRTLLVFKQGCAYRRRLEEWIGSAGAPAGRTVELGSYQTMLGCAASGMGVAIMPRSVTDMLSGASGVSVHTLPPDLARAETSLIWRAGGATGAIRALAAMVRKAFERP